MVHFNKHSLSIYYVRFCSKHCIHFIPPDPKGHIRTEYQYVPNVTDELLLLKAQPNLELPMWLRLTVNS